MWKSGILLRPGGLYAEISSNLFTAVKYQAAVTVSVHLSGNYLRGLVPDLNQTSAFKSGAL